MRSLKPEEDSDALISLNQQLNGVRLLVCAANFPNRIQPWLLRTTTEVIDRGAEVTVCAFDRLGASYPEAVERYGLLERVFYVRGPRSGGLRLAVEYALGPVSWARTAARSGIGAAVSVLLSSGVRPAIDTACNAIVEGLDNIDLVHSHSMPMSLRLLETIRKRRLPFIHTFHGLPPRGVPVPAPDQQRRLYDTADLFLVNTAFARSQLSSLGCPADKIEVLPQALDPDDFPFRPLPHPGGGTLQILTVGRLHPDKGHEYALRAVRELLDAGVSAFYSIIGVGPERNALEALTTELGLTDNVRFLGEVDDSGLRSAFEEAHVFLLPSLRDREGLHEETQGVVLQEAQASGKLVVATRTGGIPECLDDGASAWIVPDRDARAIAMCIRQLLEQPESWPSWQQAGRDWVEQHYHARTIGDRLAQLYLSVLGR